MYSKLSVIFYVFLVLMACGRAPTNEIYNPMDEAAILGGKETTSENIISKYVVLIYDNSTKLYCTGVLIRSNVILTAAHCLESDAKNLSLAFGLKPLKGDYIMRTAEKSVVHDSYKQNNSSDRHDIGLIQIKGFAPTGYHPLLVPDSTFPLKTGYTFTATGYGRISGKKAPSSDTQGAGYLRNVDLQIERFSDSQNQFYINQTDGRGICSGDSGGPALMRYQNKDYVIGIASATTWNLPENLSEEEKQRYLEKKDLCKEQSIYINLKQYNAWIKKGLQELLN